MVASVTVTITEWKEVGRWLKRDFAGHKFLPSPTGALHPTLVKKVPELLLYEPCFSLVTVTNLMHLFCPTCVVTYTLFHFMKTDSN
jgi:hypothetical protein